MKVMTSVDRFWIKVDKTVTCWWWTASKREGYGRMLVGNIMISAHRFAYEQIKGKIPFGLKLHHKCNNRGCVNPEHMELVTDAVHPQANSAKTHCPQGHPYIDGNILLTKAGGRICRMCHRDHGRASSKKARACQPKQ